jgi:hypothetical protein
MATRLPDESIVKNAAWSVELDLFQDTKRTIPFVFTGYTAKAQLNAIQGDAASKLTDLTITIGSRDPDTEIFSEDPTGNVVRLSLTLAEAAALTTTEGFADLLVGPVGLDPERVAYFKAVIGEGETEWP